MLKLYFYSWLKYSVILNLLLLIIIIIINGTRLYISCLEITTFLLHNIYTQKIFEIYYNIIFTIAEGVIPEKRTMKIVKCQGQSVKHEI